MLLVTRGIDAKSEEQVFQLFKKHFVETDLVSKDYEDVVTLGKMKLLGELSKRKDEILQLAQDMESLYKGMDDSLRFKSERKEADDAGDSKAADFVEKDFRGVACPMNFVKTKLVLEPMTSGEKLKILLDDGEPINNVPNSVKLEGHKILEQTQVGPHWEVLIQRK